MQHDDRAGEINDDVALMREWSTFPVRVIDRSNIEPRINGAHTTTVKELREKYIHGTWMLHTDHDFDA
jgi:hypothetical protein